MATTIKYPVGIQTFSEIIREGYLYIDKTAILHHLVSTTKYVFLSRPRRFGKSLLMSTLESYFKGEKELFKNLEINNLEREWTTFPVFRFDMSAENFINKQRVIEHIESYLDRFERKYSLSSDGSIAQRFRLLIEQAYDTYGKKVVVLIDEYDKPMLDCLQNEEVNEEIKAELRGFYSVLKSCDEYIRFAMLTGVSKFGKVSIFSGLNNLSDISMLPQYNAICGITETEFNHNFQQSVISFAHAKGISESETREKFKNLYDGYHFASSGEDIYNPFSVLSAFRDLQLNQYWYSTGSPSYLIRLIETNSYPVDQLEGERRSQSQLSDISNMNKDLVPLLYQSGYLTIKGYDEQNEEYILGFPNKEVSGAFWKSLAEHFFYGTDGSSTFKLREFVKEINDGEPEKFLIRLRALFADTNSEHELNKEIHFQNMIAIFAKMLGFIVRTEIHSAIGRCDLQIFTPHYIYIMEFKLNGDATSALKQIEEKGYAIPFDTDSRKKFLIGINFSTKSRTIDDWEISK